MNKKMTQEQFYKHISELHFIAHRLGFVMTDYPENSLPVLETIFNNKEMLDSCDGFEFDICFTKDHIPVVTHDKYIDDISNKKGLISSYSLDELKKIDFSFRKSLQTKNIFTFKIITLDEILAFFSSNYILLKKKIIKIESKNFAFFNKKDMKILADILNKYPDLSGNIVHLSFFPNNLVELKKIQKKKNFAVVKSDLLWDYRCFVLLSKFIRKIDFISLRIKTKNFPELYDGNSKRVNRKIFLDTFFMKFSDTINEKTLKYAINKFGSVGLYVLNDDEDIHEFCEHISYTFFDKYWDKMYFTTDNPLYLKVHVLEKNRDD